MNKIKPLVGIIYSDNCTKSYESKSLALYFAGNLSASGYAKIYLVGVGNSDDASSTDRIYYCNPGTATPTSLVNKVVQEAVMGDIHYDSWSILPQCDLILIVTNNCDMELCIEQLVKALGNREKGINNKHSKSVGFTDIAIVCLQRSLKNNGIMKEEIRAKIANGIAVIDAVVGFAVIPTTMNNRDNVYTPTVYCPFLSNSGAISIGLERMNKDDMKIADKPLRLLEVLPGIQYYYRRTLTPLAWGMLLFEYMYVINMLSGGTLTDTMRHSSCRLLYATMLAESRALLLLASRGGAWQADFSLSNTTYITTWICVIFRVSSIWLLELLLSLPDVCFNWLYIATWYWNIRSSSQHTHIISPGQYDWVHMRSSNILSNMQELVQYSEKFGQLMPVTKVLYDKVMELDKLHQQSHNNRQLSADKYMFAYSEQYIQQIYQKSLQDTGIPIGKKCRTELFHASIKVFCGLLIFLLFLYVIYYYIMIFDDTIEYA